MRVLVCGGRDYGTMPSHEGRRVPNKAEIATMRLYLRFLRSCDTVIHGAARGADSLAGVIASEYGCAVEEYPADWKGRGKMAGMERNRLMLEKKPDIVIAFPGGTGTANMVRIAVEAGVPVRIIG